MPVNQFADTIRTHHVLYGGLLDIHDEIVLFQHRRLGPRLGLLCDQSSLCQRVGKKFALILFVADELAKSLILNVFRTE